MSGDEMAVLTSVELTMGSMASGLMLTDLCFGVGAVLRFLSTIVNMNITASNLRVVAWMYLFSVGAGVIGGAMSVGLHLMSPILYGVLLANCLFRLAMAAHLMAQANFMDRWRR